MVARAGSGGWVKQIKGIKSTLILSTEEMYTIVESSYGTPANITLYINYT